MSVPAQPWDNGASEKHIPIITPPAALRWGLTLSWTSRTSSVPRSVPESTPYLLPVLHGGCERRNPTFSRCPAPPLGSPCRNRGGGGKSYHFLPPDAQNPVPLTKERRAFTYRCKPWAQHKQLFEYEKGQLSPIQSCFPDLKKRKDIKLRLNSTFISLPSHLATPSWSRTYRLSGAHATQ